MLTIELLTLLTEAAMRYRLRAMRSLDVNAHTHRMDPDNTPSQDQLDAVLTDFINAFAGGQGIDYALYSRDLAACPYPAGSGWLLQDTEDLLRRMNLHRDQHNQALDGPQQNDT
jgi:hypothetical protein